MLPSLVVRLSESKFHASERRATIKAILNLRRNDELASAALQLAVPLDAISRFDVGHGFRWFNQSAVGD